MQMIPLIALISGSAKAFLTGDVGPVDSINQLDISLSEIDPVKQQLPIYPIPSPAVLYFSPYCFSQNSVPINSKELGEYQILQLDDNPIPSCLPWSEIDTQDTESISSTTTHMAAGVIPNTSTNIEPASGFHDNYSMISPSSDPWPQGLLNKDDHITYGDLRDWLNGLDGIYNEESVFRSILDLPYPTEQSQLLPDQISTRPTYGWVLDNFLTDWIKERVMQAAAPDPVELMNDGMANNNESPQQVETSKTFDQIYIPFIDQFDRQDEEQASEFYQKIYELLTPLRGLLVIAITAVDRPQGNDAITRGRRLGGLLHQSGIPADNIRVMGSHRHSYLLAKRSENGDQSSPPNEKTPASYWYDRQEDVRE